MTKKPVIVGIDPGTTTAIAFLDAYGKPVEIKSGRHFDTGEIIREIREHGSPMIVGTDKSSLPSTMKDVVTKFKCRVSVPDEDLSKEKKSELTEPYKHMIENEHEKDALASALQAYRSYYKSIRKIKRRSDGEYEEVVRKKLLGIEEKKEEKEERGVKKPSQYRREYEERIKNLNDRVNDLEKTIEDREHKIDELKEEISEMKEKRGITERETYLQSRINRLKREKEKIKDRISEILKAHDRGKLRKMNEAQMRRKKYTEDPETFEELKERGEEAYLVDILHETDSAVYYIEKDRSTAKGNVVKDMLEKYRKNRK